MFDTVLETGDRGSFNSWGRDLYWSGKHREVSEPEVKKDPKLPYLDAVEPIILDALEWLAAMCYHVPNKGEQMVRYYGFTAMSVGVNGRRQMRKDWCLPSCSPMNHPRGTARTG